VVDTVTVAVDDVVEGVPVTVLGVVLVVVLGVTHVNGVVVPVDGVGVDSQ